MNPEKLQEILRLHGMWLRGEIGGARADLYGANLRGTDLSGASLSGANLIGADLSRADLREVNLREASLARANLSGADLYGANLCEANLIGGNLHGANLHGADLRGAHLRWAGLTAANLSCADLRGAIDGAVCRMDFGGWSICIRATDTSIGCQRHANDKWLAWSPDDVAHMHADARDWWAVHGEAVKAAIRCVMAKAAKEKEVA